MKNRKKKLFFFGHINTGPLRHKEKIQKVNTEKSIKRKECPEHVSNGRTKKSHAKQDSDEGGLSPSPLLTERSLRKFNSMKMLQKVVMSSC